MSKATFISSFPVLSSRHVVTRRGVCFVWWQKLASCTKLRRLLRVKTNETPPNPSRNITNASTQAQKGNTPALLVVDHGSKRAAANDMLSTIADMLRLKTSIPVYTAHMEIASPSIADGIRLCVKDGITHIIVVPFFLSPGRHATADIPRLTAEACEAMPAVSYEVRPPIGTHSSIIDIILDRAGLLESVQN